tara:strand:- start:382 stop:528 length:147 start_codon:yes stop_codon:yes gene_type:complete
MYPGREIRFQFLLGRRGFVDIRLTPPARGRRCVENGFQIENLLDIEDD